MNNLMESMNKLQEFNDKKAILQAEAKALLNRDDVTADEISAKSGEIEATNAKIEAQNQLIEDEKAAIEAQKKNNEPVNDPLYGPVGDTAAKDKPVFFLNPKDKTYKNMFGSVKSNSGFKSFGEFAKSIRMGDSSRLLNSSAGNENVGSEGGWLVPTEYAAQMINAAIENSVILPGAAIVPMTTKEKQIPSWENSDHTQGVVKGVKALWGAELHEQPIQVPECKAIKLAAKLLILLTAASQQLTEDDPDYEANLQPVLTQALTFEWDNQLINGDGIGHPLGMLNSPSMISIPKEDGQTAGTITYVNIIKMLSRLYSGCFNNAVWIAHSSVLPSLYLLNYGTNSNVVNNVFTNDTDGNYRLFGKPVLFSEKCQPIGTCGDLILVDRSQYVVGLRKQITLDMTDQVFFTSLKKCYRGVARVDGLAAWDKPITPLHGATTMSWCVTLQDRH